MYTVLRLQHPIGQGGFFSECLWEGAAHPHKNHVLIYDCGSGKAKASRQFQAYLNRFHRYRWSGHQIDALVISHFHSDHVNGIRHLNLAGCSGLKRVFIPDLSTQDEVVVHFVDAALPIAEASAAGGLADMAEVIADVRTLAANPADLFDAETEVIRISPSVDAFRASDVDDVEEGGDLLSVIRRGTRADRVPIIARPGSSRSADWIMKFYCRKPAAAVVKAVANNLMAMGFDPRWLTGDIQPFIRWLSAHGVRAIQGAYLPFTQSRKAHNMISLCCYSGPRFHIPGTHPLSVIAHDETSGLDFAAGAASHVPLGWIGTGDLSLKDPADINSFRSHYQKLWPEVGTVQIPHHGSDENFTSPGPFPRVSTLTVSYGSTNTYGHPDSAMLAAWRSSSVMVHEVTESFLSLFGQAFRMP